MKKVIHIYKKEDRAFVEIGSGYMLCIGSIEAVSEATPREVERMIERAIAENKWLGLDSSETTIH